MRRLLTACIAALTEPPAPATSLLRTGRRTRARIGARRIVVEFERCCFMLKQPALAIESATVSSEGSIGGDDAVAGNTIAIGLRPLAKTARRRGPRPPDPAGELGIAAGQRRVCAAIPPRPGAERVFLASPGVAGNLAGCPRRSALNCSRTARKAESSGAGSNGPGSTRVSLWPPVVRAAQRCRGHPLIVRPRRCQDVRHLADMRGCHHTAGLAGFVEDTAARRRFARGLSVHSGRSSERRVPKSPPLSIYSAPGGLRQDPGRAA